MTIKSINLPLYSSPDYQYSVPIQDTTYIFHLFFNERMKQWIFDILYENGSAILLGEVLVPEYPMLVDYVNTPVGILYLEPIGDTKNETTDNPYEIWQYYNLFFIYSEDDGT